MSLSKKLKLKKNELIAVGKQKREDKEPKSTEKLKLRLTLIESRLTLLEKDKSKTITLKSSNN